MRDTEIHLRLRADNPFHLRIIEWLDGLPENKRGKSNVSMHIVSALLFALEHQKPVRGKKRKVKKKVDSDEKNLEFKKNNNNIDKKKKIPEKVNPFKVGDNDELKKKLNSGNDTDEIKSIIKNITF